MTKSYCLAKVANASIFSAGIIFPDGLDGVLIIITLVLSVIAFSTSSTLNPNFSPSGLSTTIGFAWHICTICS